MIFYLKNFFCQISSIKKVKVYFLKDFDELKLDSIVVLTSVYKKEGKAVVFNEYGAFILEIILIIIIILWSWPLIYYLPNNIFGYYVLNTVFIMSYQFIIVFARFKRNQSHNILNENSQLPKVIQPYLLQ